MAQQEDLFSLRCSESSCQDREAYLRTYELSVLDGGTSVGMDTSAPKLWLAGAGPLLRSTDGMLTELQTG